MSSIIFKIFAISLIYNVCGREIVFPEENKNDCQLPGGGEGRCRDQSQCPEAFRNFPEVTPTICGFNRKSPIVCCPPKPDTGTDMKSTNHDQLTNDTSTVPMVGNPKGKSLQTSPPIIDFDCGNSNPEIIYELDITCPNCLGVGGEPARIVLAKYTALIGFQEADNDTEWVCSGVLINHLWVLTAAHCNMLSINIVRLGEYDYKNSTDGARHIDFEIEENYIYPEYKDEEGYHDLALLKLSVPEHQIYWNAPTREYINPVCLPWDNAQSKNLVDETVSLTGWGATEFGGSGSSIIQEVNVTVLPTSVCDQGYSNLRDYHLVWPRGISETILCVGDPQGGKDACQGDSGGPVTYLNEKKKYVLAGVVSRGYGCGLSTFPGIYADVRHPAYLSWIKKVAFQ